MNRRELLRLGLSATALPLLAAGRIFPAAAQTHDHAGHTEHAGMAMSKPESGVPLLPADDFPAGKPLQPLTKLKNTGKTRGLFRATLTARARKIELVRGKPTTFLTYNGQIPGPQIVANEGDTVEIDFRNELDEPTTVHWHGLPVPPAHDGNPQDPVAPGERRLYRFTLPTGSAGTYWYHPHPHGLAAAQAYRGLAGTFIVRAKKDPLAHFPEQHWLFSDLRLAADGTIPGNTALDWMNGREGQFVLLNGQLRPRITLKGTQRVRIWNACNARYLLLTLPGHTFTVVGTDGGLLEKPAAPTETLLIVPGERYEVLITPHPEKRGGSKDATLLARPYNRQKMMQDFVPETLILAQVRLRPGKTRPAPAALRPLPNFDQPATRQEITFTEVMDHSAHGHLSAVKQSHNPADFLELLTVFRVNGKTYDMDRIDLKAEAGKVQDWTINNNSHMDHPFHIHGTQFIVIERVLGNHTERPAPALKDTLNLRPYEKVRIRFIQRDPGLRPLHCHILEHEALGMMAQLQVL